MTVPLPPDSVCANCGAVNCRNELHTDAQLASQPLSGDADLRHVAGKVLLAWRNEVEPSLFLELMDELEAVLLAAGEATPPEEEKDKA